MPQQNSQPADEMVLELYKTCRAHGWRSRNHFESRLLLEHVQTITQLSDAARTNKQFQKMLVNSQLRFEYVPPIRMLAMLRDAINNFSA